MKKLMVVLILFGISFEAGASDWRRTPHRILDLPDTQIRVHHDPNIALTVTNFGCLGSWDGQYIDPETGLPAEGMEFPTGSDINYLFNGSIWIGAEIDTIDNQGRPVFDTVVSVGNDGWWANIYELFPAPAGIPSLWEEDSQSDEDIYAVYSDTATDSRWVNPDPNDGRRHIPLGLEITQVSHAWASPGYNEFIPIDFHLRNIGQRNLHNVYIGIYFEGDVYHISENPYGNEEGAQDDLCGFIERDENGIGWVADNDGQPYDSAYENRSPRGICGIVLLRSSEGNLRTSFNWWMPNINHQFDWGPQFEANYHGPFPGGGRGTPGGDKAKYQVMSNGERDYDQAYAALPHPLWIEPPPTVGEIANGFDTRFLISFGPLQMLPGEIDTITVALLAGHNLHNDPTNYESNLRTHVTDSMSIAQYYQNLDFSDLIAKADSAEHFYLAGYPSPPLGPPHNFRVAECDESHALFMWSPKISPALQEYRLYRGLAPGVYDPTPRTPPGFRDTSYTDSGFENNVPYYYALSCIDTAGREGRRSNPLCANPGIPAMPRGITTTSGNAEVTVTWMPNEEDDLLGYIVLNRIEGQDFAVDTTYSASFTDTGLRNGMKYYYRIAALDLAGYISPYADSVVGLPMGLDQGILLFADIRETPFCPDYYSILTYYNHLLNGYRYAISAQLIDSLNDIAAYSTVIWASETILSRIAQFETSTNIGIFSEYLQAGGNLIITGQRNFVTPYFTGQRNFGANEFQYTYLNLAGTRYANTTTSDFRGGMSLSPAFTDFELDSARVARIINLPRRMDGRLIDVGVLVPRESFEAIFAYRASAPETSSLHGFPIATVHTGPTYMAATIEFPLYYVREEQSINIMHRILADFGEAVGIEDRVEPVPMEFAISGSYPNPFNSATTILYSLEETCRPRIEIYNLLGQKMSSVNLGIQDAGAHSITWDASGLPSGVYFARLLAGDHHAAAKLLLIK